MKKLLLAAAMMCAVAAVSAQGEVLRLDLKKGDVLNHRMSTAVDMTQNMMGQDIKIRTEVNGEIRYEIVDIEDGNYVMDISYTRLGMAVKTPMAQTEMSGSSDTPEAGDVFSPILAAMTGKSFTMTMSPSGRVMGVDNIGNLYAGLENMETFSSLSPEATRQIIEQVKESYGAEKMKSNLEMGMAAFPDAPLNVGDKWTTQSTVNSGMPMDMTITYTLVERTAERIVLKAATAVKTVKGRVMTNGIEMEYDLEGTVNSDITLDPATCWTITSMNTMNLAGSITLFKNERLPADMTVPLTMKSTTTYTDFR